MKVSIKEYERFITICEREYIHENGKCDGQLFLFSAVVMPDRDKIPILPGGFVLSGSTSEEFVRCSKCGHISPLEYFTHE